MRSKGEKDLYRNESSLDVLLRMILNFASLGQLAWQLESLLPAIPCSDLEILEEEEEEDPRYLVAVVSL